jgi:hypothetical protein
MSWRAGIAVLVVVLGLGGCGGSGGGGDTPVAPPSGALAEHIVAPAATDAGINNWLDDHYAYRDTRVAARGRLLVHLPGSYGTPVNSQTYMKEMAAAGNHVIGLRYPNSWEVTNLCANDADLTCYERVRLEIIDGIDRGTLVTVNTSNSIVNRLIKLLQYLASTWPDEGWDQYLVNGQPVWSRIMLSGHSQGAGHAAVIGKYYVLDRVLMFAAPGDLNSYGVAPWQDRNHVTLTAGYFGFNHDRDSLTAKLAVWTLMGLADYGAVITDDKTPLLPDGTPRYAPVWRYLCCS